VFAHTRTALARLHNPSTILALATLLHDAGKPVTYQANSDRCFEGHAQAGAKISEEICRRLKLSNEETSAIADLVAAHRDFMDIHEMRESARQRLLRKPNIADHLELLRVNCLSSRKSLEVYFLCVRKAKEYGPAPAPLVNGEDLLAMGYAPGPLFGEMLRAVEELQLEGALKTREEALQHVRTSFPLADKSPSLQ
jgi:tRNA nucleotidyltransferase/poly(A) polymerase